MEYQREYTLRASDGTEVLVDRPVDTENFYQGWRVTLNGDEMTALRVIRYRDGGTTSIDTERGRLHVPSPLIDSHIAHAYWDFGNHQLPLERVDDRAE